MKKLVRYVTPLSDYNLLDFPPSPGAVSVDGSQIVLQDVGGLNPLNQLLSGLGADFNYLYSSSSPSTPINISGGNSNTSPHANPYTQALSGASTGASSSNATSDASAVNHRASGVSGASGVSATPSSQSLAVALDIANPTPVTHIPGTVLRITEDAAVKTIHGISVSVADANSEITVHLSVAHGTLAVSTTLSSRLTDAGITGLTNAGIQGQGTGTLTLTGTATAINATLTTLSYTVTPNFSGSDTLSVSSSVGGSPALSSSGTMAIDVAAVNDAPTLAGIPDSAPLTLIFVSVAADLANFSANDADGANTTLYVTLVPTGGSIGGFTNGSANGLTTHLESGTVHLTGTAAAINAALAAASFTASAAGTASIAVRVSDVSLADTSPATSSTRSYSFNAERVPLLSIPNGQDAYINATETGIDVELAFDGLAQNGTVQIRVDGTLLPTTYTATASDASSHKITLNIAKADLGSDGPKTITAELTQNGTSTTSARLTLTLDTTAPDAPTLAVGAGVSGGATAAEATQASGVVTVHTESGSTVLVTFTDSASPTANSVVKTATGTGAAQAVTLASTDLGTGAAKLLDGTITVSATATDAAGNASTAGTGTFTLDTVAPTLTTISSDKSALKKGETATITFTFSEDPGSSFSWDGSMGDVSVTGGTLGALSGSGTTRTATFTPTDDVNAGSASISVANGTFTDAAGNPGTGASASTISFDTMAPAAPSLATDAGVSGGATAAEATAASGVFSVNAESGSTVRVTFTDSASPTVHSVVKTVTGTGAAIGVTLASTDLGTGAAKLLDGTITVSAVATDAAGNASTAGTGTFTLDTVAPTLAITSSVSAVKAGETVTITFTFSETPTDFDSSDIVVTGGTLGTLSGNGTTRTATFTPTANTDSTAASITVAANGYTDAAGNNGGAGTTPMLIVDTKAPTLAITSSVSAVKAGETATITFTFSETPTGFDSSDITVTGGTLGTLSGNGTTRTATFTPTANIDSTTASITVAANGYTDAAGNNGGAGTTPMLTVDTKAPTLAITSSVSAVKAGETATITFTFSEAPTGFDSSDIVVTGGTLGTLSGSGTTRTATFTPTDDVNAGSASISVANGTFTDAAGNNGTGASASTINFDTMAPAAPSLAPGAGVSDGATAAEATAASGVVTVHAESGSTVRVTFTDSDSPAHSVVKTATGTGAAQAVTLASTDLGTGATKLLDGTITVSATATDVAGNLSMAGSSSFTLDTAAPTVTAIALAAKDEKSGQSYAVLNEGDTVDIAVTFSEAVNITGSPLLALVIGGGSSNASYLSADARNTGASATKYFRYTVAAGDTDANGISIAANALSLNGASITDAAGNAAATTHSITVADNAAYSIDTSTPAAPTLAPGAGVSNGATAAEATASTGVITVNAESGSTVRVTFTDNASPTTHSVVKTATGTGAAQAVTLESTDLGTGATKLLDGAITVTATATDTAGNLSMAGSSSFTLDTAAPTVTAFALATKDEKSGQSYTVLNEGDTVDIVVTFSEAVTITGSPLLALTIGSGTANASYLSGDARNAGASTTKYFRYTVAAGDNDTNGISIAANALSLNSGANLATITDAAGNAATTTHSITVADNATYSIDTSAPAAPTLRPLGMGVSGGATAAEATAADGVVIFNAERGSTLRVTLTGTSGTVTKSISDANTVFPGFGNTVADLGEVTGYLDGSFTAKYGNGSPTVRTYTDIEDLIGTLNIDLAFSTTQRAILRALPAPGRLVLTSADLTTLGNGTISISTTATDAAGNVSPAATGSFNLDTVAPTLAITSSSSLVKAGQTATITFTFSEDPGSSFDASDITLAGNGTLGTLSGGGATRTAVFTPTADVVAGSASISVTNGTFTDAAGNLGTGGSAASISINTKVPSLTGASLQGATTLNLTFDTALDSAAFTGITPAALNNLFSFKTAPSGGGTYQPVSSAFTAISVSGSTVTLTLSNSAYTSGQLAQISYTAPAGDQSTGVVQDAGGNDLASINNTPVITTPVIFGFAVSDTGNSNGTALGKAGETVTVAVSFSADVTLTVNSTYTVSVQVGSNPSDSFNATFVPASATAASSYNFTGTLPSTTGLSTSTLKLKSLAFPDDASIVAGTQALTQKTYDLASTAYTVDSLAPTVSSMALVAKSESTFAVLNTGDTVDVAVTFSEAVTITGSPRVALTIGASTVYAGYLSADARNTGASATKYFRYTVAAGDTDATGISIAANALDLNSGANLATIADPAGNAATITHALVADNSDYRIDTSTPDAPTLALGAGVSGGATAAEATAIGGVITVNAESGSTVRVTFTDSASPSPNTVVKTVTGIGAMVGVALANTDITGVGRLLQEGTIRVTATVTDAAGNTNTTVSNTSTFTLDTVAPNAPTLAIGSGVTGQVSGAEALAATGVITVNAESGSTVLVTFTDSAPTPRSVVKTATGTGSATAVTLGSTDLGLGNGQLGDGSITVRATTTDSAGNLSSVSNTSSFALDATLPAQPTLLLGTGVAGGANAAEATASSGVVTVTAESGSTVLVTFTDSAATPSSLVRTLTGTGVAQAVTLGSNDITGAGRLLQDGAIRVNATATDAAGNLSTVGTNSFTLDAVAPAAPTLGQVSGIENGASAAEATAASGVVTVTAESGSTVRVTFTDSDAATPDVVKTVTGTGAAVGVALASSDVGNGATQLRNGGITATATATDSAGNTSAVSSSFTFTLDATAPVQPTLVLGAGVADGANAAEAMANTGVVTVKAENASTVRVTFTDNAATPNTLVKTLIGTGATQAVRLASTDFGSGANQLLEGSIRVTATATDHAGNVSTAGTTSFEMDAALPSVSLSLGSGVANGATAAEATASTGVVSLTAESGSLVTLSFTNQDNTRITRLITGTGSAQAITLTAAEIGAYANQLHDGTITVNAVAVDRAGNVNTAVSSFVLDTVGPQASLFLTSTNRAWIGDVSVFNGTPGAGNFYDLATFTSNAGWMSFNAEAGSTLTATYYTNFFNVLTNNPFLSRDYPAVGGAQLQPIILTSADLAPYLPLATSGNPLRMKFVLKDMAGNSTEINIGSASIDTPPAAPTLTLGAGISNTNGATATEASNGAFSTVTTDAVLVTTFTDDFGRSYVPAVYATGVGAGVPKSFGLPAGQLQDGTITATVYSASFYNSISAPASISFVYDTTAPKLAAATIAADRASIVLTFTEAIDSSALTLAEANTKLVFKTNTGGIIATPSPAYSGISVSGNTVTLALSTALTASQTATIEYTAAAGDQTSAVVQDTAGNDMATLSAFSLSAVPVVSGFVVSDSGNSNGTNRGKAGETVTVQVNFSEAVTLSANTTYTARVQIGSNSANYIDATLVTLASAPAANSSYSFTGTLPATTGLASNALTLISLSGSGITGSNSRALTQASYTTLSSNSYLVDSDAPTLTISSAIAGQTLNKTNLGAGNTATITFNFTEDPGSSFAWDGSSGDITVTGGTLSALWGAGQKRYAKFVPTPNSSGVASISVAAGSYTDAAGNAGGSGTRTISYDTQPPLTPIIKLGSGVLGGATPAEMAQASGVVTVEAELGQQVSVIFTDSWYGYTTVKGVIGAGIGNPVPVVLTAAEVGALFQGEQNVDGANSSPTTASLQVKAVATDSAGNQSQSNTSFFYDNVPSPSGALVTIPDTGISNTDGYTSNTLVTPSSAVTNITTGQFWQYSTDNGTTWIKGVGTSFSLAKNVSYPINSIQVRVVDAAGNIGGITRKSRAYTTDTIAPDAPGVTLLDGLGNSANGATAQITAESGSSVVVTFSDGTRSIPKTVTSQGSAVNATLAVSDFGLGAAQLRDGPITVTAVATDLAGNVGAANTSQFVRNSSTPALSVKSGQDAFVNSTESVVDVYVYTAALASGDTLQLQLGGNNLGSAYPVTASDVTAGRVALTINKADLTGGDGQKSISAVLTQNGTATTSAPLLLTLDTGVPLAPTLQLGSGVADGATLAEATSSAASTGVVFVSAESAARVAVTFTDSGNRKIVKQVTGLGSNVPVPVVLLADDIGSRSDQLQDGTITISAIATDLAGNASTAGSSSFALYANAPATAPALALAPGVVGLVSQPEAYSPTGLLNISGQSGTTAWLTFSDGVRTLHKTQLLTGGTDTVVLEGHETGTGTAQLHNGTITVSGVQVDVAGNISPVANTRFVLEALAPTLDLNSGTAGTDTSTTILAANASSFGTNTRILPLVAPVPDNDVQKITLSFTDVGSNMLRPGDRLKVGSVGATVQDLDLNTATDLPATSVTLGSVTGLDYAYNASTNLLTLSMHDGSAFTGSTIASLLGELQFRNSSATIPTGTRDFSVQLIDIAGNNTFATGSVVI